MAYTLQRPVYKENEKGFKTTEILGHEIRYYYSSINNNALFEHLIEIHDIKTLNEFINKAVVDIAGLKKIDRDGSDWKFYYYFIS